MLVGEVLGLVGLLERGDDTRFGRGADDGHWVAGLLQALELFGGTGAGLALGLEFGSDGTQLLSNVLFELICGHLEVVLLLETDHHATEVLANEGFEEVIDGVAFGDFVHLEEFIREIGAGFEGETL